MSDQNPFKPAGKKLDSRLNQMLDFGEDTTPRNEVNKRLTRLVEQIRQLKDRVDKLVEKI